LFAIPFNYAELINEYNNTQHPELRLQRIMKGGTKGRHVHGLGNTDQSV